MVNPIEVIEKIREVEDAVGGFIAGDGPDSPLANYVRNRYQRNCRAYSNVPGWLRGLGPAGQTVGRMCKRYLDDNGWSGVDSELPFTGGQCAGERYVVTIRSQGTVGVGTLNPGGTGCGTASSTEFGLVDTILGPIQGVRREVVGPASSEASFVQYFIQAGNGEFNTGAIIEGGSCPSAGKTITSVRKFDNSPDECGDPPVEIKPGPNPAPDPGPIPPDEEPRPNPDDPTIPDFPVPDFPDPVFGPTPVAPPGGGGGNRPNPLPEPTVGDPIENDEGSGGGDEDFGEPPEGEEWVGAFLELTEVPMEYGSIAGSGPQNTVYPRVVGNASLYGDGVRYDARRVLSGWSDHFVEIPRLPVDGLRVTVLPDVRYRVYPVSLPIPEEE